MCIVASVTNDMLFFTAACKVQVPSVLRGQGRVDGSGCQSREAKIKDNLLQKWCMPRSRI